MEKIWFEEQMAPYILSGMALAAVLPVLNARQRF